MFTSNQISEANHQLKIRQQRPLSGGITATKLKITDNEMGMLTLNGEVSINIKVFDLCTSPTPALPFLMTSTKQLIQSIVSGPVYSTGNNYYKYDAKKNRFDGKQFATFTVLYNFNFKINIIQINSLAQLNGNDFVVAVVDGIGARFQDHYGTWHSMGGFESGLSGGPVIVKYSSWASDRAIATHEIFHTLGLADSENPSERESIMYHLENGLGKTLMPKEKLDLMRGIIGELKFMVNPTYSNANQNTAIILRQQLNKPANGIQYDKNKLR